jgi:tetratricopeptide (TPR) repeat protein
VFSGLKLELDRIPRAEVPGASILYLPKGTFLQYMSFGNRSFMADLIYLWAIQYFSNTLVPDRFNHLEHVFGIISELDPRYEDPYRIGAIISLYDARDPVKAFRILDLGLEKNPDNYIFPWIAGHYAQMMKDFESARSYYRKAMEIEGAPEMTRRLYANAAAELDDHLTAYRYWMDIYKDAEREGDERIIKIAVNHLYRNKAALDIEALTRAIAAYRQRFGVNPPDLEELVRVGLLTNLPTDLDGRQYVYVKHSGEVTTAVQWWKR